ncbi:MAG: hypothetical protein A4E32_00595 [Methanomassiliicoccales archaeon PtaU1.Bin124]|nr:MAG: hypothetical protein A4E32_00595 [Methanomassiliicoccales archaeon PtaU1.Bin124]
MKAYIRVLYSSEGRSPADVLQIMKDLGFSKVKGQPLFEGEAADEETLSAKLEDVHAALKGMVVRYIPSVGGPSDEAGNVICQANESLQPWRGLGVDVDELTALLDSDVDKFRSRAVEVMKQRIDAIAEAKEKELEEARKAREAELARQAEQDRVAKLAESINLKLTQEGGVNFHELHDATGLEADELSDMLNDMIQAGKVKAEQKGRRVVYSSA